MLPLEHLDRLIDENPVLCQTKECIWDIYTALRGCFGSGGKLLLCGNGGSAADCEHIAGELMKGFLLKRPVPREFAAHPALDGEGEFLQGALPAIPLTGNFALSTAFANDVDPTLVFAQQVYGYGKPSDTLLALSTSGNARNVLQALRVARAIGMTTIGITGATGGAMRALCDNCLCLPAAETYRVQELTLPVYHALCAMLESNFFKT